MRVLAVTDSDSYVKWGAAVLTRMPTDWATELVVLDTDGRPSERQLAAALAGTRFAEVEVARVTLAELVDLVRTSRPDVVLLSVRGMVVRVIIHAIVTTTVPRPVFVSGLPGISIPVTRKALFYRAQADLILLHSEREVREFAALAIERGYEQQFALARLPFLPEPGHARADDGDFVFAAQAKVPKAVEHRVQVLQWLIETAKRHPARRVILKLRASAGEQQTHGEKFPYDQLLAAIDAVPPNLVVSHGSMATHLETAAGLVTVSSTAAVEAVALGVPALVLDDFGVSRELINTVFDGSGLLADSRSLIEGRFRHPNPGWLADNYFHPVDREDWIRRIEALVQLHATAPVTLRARPPRRIDGPLRHAWDRRLALGSADRSVAGTIAAAVGTPARWASLRTRALKRRIRRRLAGRVPDAAALASPESTIVSSADRTPGVEMTR